MFGVFYYDDSYKMDTAKPVLFDFSDKELINVRPVLWSLFLIRIPSIKQPKIQKIVAKKGINPSNLIEMLDIFGEKSFKNPYLLVHQ